MLLAQGVRRSVAANNGSCKKSKGKTVTQTKNKGKINIQK
jgi:hypothetical protein